MHAVGILVFLAVAGLVWHHLARSRQREDQAAHRAFRAAQARFWATRLQADDARRGGRDEADALLHECARLLVLGATAGVCGLLATRFGDHFWYWISGNLWWIRR
jgi:hypothetical protein